MSQPLVFDYILGKMRLSDALLASAATISIPDPLIVNQLSVNSLASMNLLMVNNIYGSSASVGHLTTNTLNVFSTASIYLGHFVGVTASNISSNTIYSSNIFSSTATIGNIGLTNLQWDLVNGNGTAEGQMSWDSVNQTVTLGMAGGNVDVALGLETLFPKRVKNSTATTMPKGSVVYINGVSGNDPTVTFAKATSDFSSAYTLGLTSESITAGQKGWVTTFGEVTGLNLSAFTGGDTLYLSGATAGLFTNVKPQAPIHYVRIGTVVKATADGILVVNVINGFETNELHDVVIASLASGHILQSNGSLWYNVPPAFIPTASYPSLGSLAILNELSYNALVSKPSLGSLAPLNTLNINQLAGVSITSLASGQILISNSTTFINTTSIYVSFYGLLDEDPTSSSVKNGDNYWNNLDTKIQVYIDKWRELNGADRLDAQNANPLQAENGAYLQVEFQYVSGAYIEENIFPEVP